MSRIYSTLDMLQLTCAEPTCEKVVWSVVPLDGWKCEEHRLIAEPVKEIDVKEEEKS